MRGEKNGALMSDTTVKLLDPGVNRWRQEGLALKQRAAPADECTLSLNEVQGRPIMFDEFERLCQTKPLFCLLAHYADLGARDRETWQDRVMSLAGVAAKELSRLHGELIAYGWVEQNTGTTPVLKPGVAACCYRITSAGLKTFRLAKKQQAGIRELEEVGVE